MIFAIKTKREGGGINLTLKGRDLLHALIWLNVKRSFYDEFFGVVWRIQPMCECQEGMGDKQRWIKTLSSQICILILKLKVI